MRSTNITSWIITALILLALLSLPASAQTKQVVTNGTFETDVSGWTTNAGTLSHTTTEVHTGSGAAQLSSDASNQGQFAQCIDLSGELGDWPTAGDGKKYVTVSGYIKTTSSITGATTYSYFYSDTTCGSFNGFIAGTDVLGGSDWTLVSATGEIPAGTQSLNVTFGQQGSPGSMAYYDDVQAYSSGPNVVTLHRLKAEVVSERGNLVWLAVLITLVAASIVLISRRTGGKELESV